MCHLGKIQIVVFEGIRDKEMEFITWVVFKENLNSIYLVILEKCKMVIESADNFRKQFWSDSRVFGDFSDRIRIWISARISNIWVNTPKNLKYKKVA
jgi:hypothetical protein